VQDAARRYAAQKVKEAEQRAKETEAETARLKKALEEKERELASTKARLEEELQACINSLNYLRGRYAELKPEQPLWARAVDLHIAAQLPPRDVYRMLIEVPYVDLDREIMRRRKIEQLLLEKYGIAKPPPLRIAAETEVVVFERNRVAKYKIPYLPPAVYIANYGLLVWRPRPSLYTIYNNIDQVSQRLLSALQARGGNRSLAESRRRQAALRCPHRAAVVWQKPTEEFLRSIYTPPSNQD
jgi:hypothetical protein